MISGIELLKKFQKQQQEKEQEEHGINEALVFCHGCGLFLTPTCISKEGYMCLSCARRLKIIRAVWILGLILCLCVLIGLSGCSSVPGRYNKGDVLQAKHFTNFPQYEGELVTVVDGLAWKPIRGSIYQGNALRVYEVETSDGRRLAAQEFQLKEVK